VNRNGRILFGCEKNKLVLTQILIPKTDAASILCVKTWNLLLETFLETLLNEVIHQNYCEFVSETRTKLRQQRSSFTPYKLCIPFCASLSCLRLFLRYIAQIPIIPCVRSLQDAAGKATVLAKLWRSESRILVISHQSCDCEWYNEWYFHRHQWNRHNLRLHSSFVSEVTRWVSCKSQNCVCPSRNLPGFSREDSTSITSKTPAVQQVDHHSC
jgi:hypothetical protein